MTASTRRELRSAATSTSTTAIDLIRALTDARPIKPTSTRCLSARRPNPGRGSTYRRGNSVQTTAATSREAMPFSENSATIIYSEHFFEHLDYPEPAKRFLKECHRILKPGGIFSVGVPDTEWPLQAYVGPDDKNYFAWSKVNCLPEWCQTRIDDINYHFRQDGEHRFAYDYETLHHALMEAGFSNIRQRAFDAGLDTESRRIGTLYVDAVK